MKARRRFAQHFLEPAWVDKLVERMQVEPSDIVLEVGPGRGALTIRLAARARSVTAIEVDRDLAAELSSSVPANVTIIQEDVLRADLATLVRDLQAGAGPAARVRVAGNLPYNISSPILFRLMDLVRGGAPLHDATLMLQREVADRVAASPGGGDWGPLAIALQLRADVTTLLALPPGAFRPMPRVHGAVVHLAFRPLRLPLGDERTFDSMVRALFGQRRKTVRNALKPFASARGLDAGALLADAGIDPRRRAETLYLEELARLAARSQF
jgi:16S rRNA (adenine1518-N6/adenine1519-N6)-dimethyltransferase